MIVFDWVLNRDDMSVVTLLIDDIDHRSQRGCFPRTGRTGHQHQTARLVKEFTDGRRNTDLFKRQEFAGNLAGHDAELALFLEDADAEPGQFTEGETKVRPAPLTHLLNVVFRGDTPHQLFGVLLLERRSFHFMQHAVKPDHRRDPDTQMQVRGAFGHDQLQ